MKPLVDLYLYFVTYASDAPIVEVSVSEALKSLYRIFSSETSVVCWALSGESLPIAFDMSSFRSFVNNCMMMIFAPSGPENVHVVITPPASTSDAFQSVGQPMLKLAVWDVNGLMVVVANFDCMSSENVNGRMIQARTPMIIRLRNTYCAFKC